MILKKVQYTEPFFILQIFIGMKRKLIITESQMNKLKSTLSENHRFTSMVKQMAEDLTANYSPSENYVREGGEYSTKRMIKVNLDEELISPKALFEYMKSKYKMGDEFTQQVINDWYFGRFKEDYGLSKNVPLN